MSDKIAIRNVAIMLALSVAAVVSLIVIVSIVL